MKKKTKNILLGISVLLLLLILPGLYNALKIVPYSLPAKGITESIRIALVTDLHSCDYGEGMRDLLDALASQEPDLVLLGGDIFDDELPDDNTIAFLRGISGRYPIYYVTGNHEYRVSPDDFAQKMATLKQWGVIRLGGEMATVQIRGTRLNICGVDDPFAWRDRVDDPVQTTEYFLEQLNHVGTMPRDGAYTILLVHRPEYLDAYSRYGFNLVLSGHTHGGVWRIPGILNGLYANGLYGPNHGLFPALVGGLYKDGATTMIVSRGLARESTRIPRIYNRPELVMIHLVPD